MKFFFLFVLLISFDIFAKKYDYEIDKYIEPKILKSIPNFPISKIDQKSARATEKDIRVIRQYYRHSDVMDKIKSNKYISVAFLYTLPFRVANPSKDLKVNQFSLGLTNAVISDFATNRSENVVLNKRNFGLAFAFGSQVSHSIKREFELVVYQAVYIYNQNTFTPGALNTERLQYTYQEDGLDITASFDNAEYIKRNISLHYNIQKDFLHIFGSGSDKRLTPFVVGGLGVTSRVTFIRLSNGVLGNGDALNNVITDVNYFKILPSFNLGAGVRYKLNDTFAINFKVNTIQVVNDISFANNYFVQLGGVAFF